MRSVHADALSRLRQMYPAVNPELLVVDLRQIIIGLKEHGTLQPGEFRPFAITTAARLLDDRSREVITTRGKIDKKGLTTLDYARMGRSLLKARHLTSTAPLYDIVSMLRDVKAGLPYSTPERVERLLRAGHAINRYVGIGACVEYGVGIVLAEARRGRRVDFAVGMGSFPRQFHAWPVVNGKPIQTEYDEIVEGKFTAFDIW